MKIRLLHVLWEGIGGIERIVLDLTRHLDMKKYEMTVAILKRGGCVTDSINKEEINVVEFGARSGKDLAALRSFYSFVRSRRFDIVHCHERSFLANLALVAQKPRPILIYHEHGGHLLFSNKRTRLTYSTFARFFDVLIATHEDMVRYMLEGSRSSAKKTLVFENAVDTDYFTPGVSAKSTLPVPPGCKIIGTVARLSPEKDFRLFFDTAKAIIEKTEDIIFLIVGEGGMRRTLQIQASNPDLRGRIILLGARSDVPSVMRTFEIFLFTSRVETFGLSVLESLACGIPVVAAKPMLGAAGIIFERSPGIAIVQERDASVLAAECLALLNDPARLANMRRSGRDYVKKNYSLDNYVQSLDRLYQGLFDSHTFSLTKRHI
jgi:glycosyltransferase involved in cell wall biosynthesis